jgi:hypothetical protein
MRVSEGSQASAPACRHLCQRTGTQPRNPTLAVAATVYSPLKNNSMKEKYRFNYNKMVQIPSKYKNPLSKSAMATHNIINEFNNKSKESKTINIIGNHNQVNQDSSDSEILFFTQTAKENPVKTPDKNNSISKLIKNVFSDIWKIISQNQLISTIVGTIVGTLIVTIILKHFKII